MAEPTLGWITGQWNAMNAEPVSWMCSFVSILKNNPPVLYVIPKSVRVQGAQIQQATGRQYIDFSNPVCRLQKNLRA